MTKESVKVRFPRHAPKHGEDWIIDPAFLLRVYHSINPDTNYGFIPSMEEIETALLALEVIPSDLYTAPPQREWQSLTDDEIEAARVETFNEFQAAVAAAGIGSCDIKPVWRRLEAKLLEKNQ